MASCEVKPELWVKRFQQIKNQPGVDDQQARVIFMKTVYGPDVKSIVQELDRKPIIPGPTYKVTPKGLTCLYAGREILLRELAIHNVRNQTPQNHNPTEEEALLSAERVILQSPTAEVVFPVYNQDGKIRYLSEWKRKDNLVETAMIDIAQDGQDKTIEEAKILMEQMAKEKKRSLIQSVETKAPLTTALRSTVVNDILVNSVLFESAILFPVIEQKPERTADLSVTTIAVAEPLFVSTHAILPTQTVLLDFSAELISMFQNLEENSETASDSVEPSSFNHDLITWPPVFEKEWLQIQKVAAELVDYDAAPFISSASMIQYFDTKSVADKPLNLATVKVKFEPAESHRSAVGYSKTVKTTVLSVDEAASAAGIYEPKAFIEVARTEPKTVEQQPVFEKAREELDLPLLAISAETSATVAVRVVLKPMGQIPEPSTMFDFEIEPTEKAVLTADELPVPLKEKIVEEIDQEQDKLFLVENFSVADHQTPKDQKADHFQIKKLVWGIRVPQTEPAEVSLLELELPKDSNQRLYAFYHFLQKAVKKVMGKDAIRTRQLTVIAEKEDINLDLELVGEIEYYLKLLRRKRNYAQAFAFAD